MINTYRPEGMIFGTPRNRELLAMGRAGLERAMAQGIIMESTALLCDSNMNLHVDLRGVTGIIPREEVCLCREGESVKDIAIITRVGKPVCFKVTSIDPFYFFGVTISIHPTSHPIRSDEILSYRIRGKT